MKHTGRMKFENLISSVALSPYIEDECLSITSRDNCIRLWDVSRGIHKSAITVRFTLVFLSNLQNSSLRE